MPISVKLQAEPTRLRVVARGALTQPERLRALARCIALLQAHPDAGVLFDARAATSAPSPAETREIIDVAGQSPTVFAAGVAIVIAEGVQYGMARMLQALLEPRGVSVSVFTDLAAAAAWLAGTAPEA